LQVYSLHDGSIYTVGKDLKNDNVVPLWDADVRTPPDATTPGRRRTFQDWFCPVSTYYVRWRIAHGQLWAYHGPLLRSSGFANLIPMEDLPLLDRENKQGDAKLREKYHVPPGDGTVDWISAHFDGPAHELALTLQLDKYAGQPCLPEGLIELDFLPTGPKGFDLFVLYDKKLIVYRATEKKGESERAYQELVPATPAGFQESFLVYGPPESPSFVTRSGKVYRLSRKANERPRVDLVWDDEKRPVTTLLTDVGSGRTFAAGPDAKDGRKGRWFCLELAGKPEPFAFDRGALDPFNADEPLRPALQFAQFLIKENKITTKGK
jgi:hypothetical protein